MFWGIYYECVFIYCYNVLAQWLSLATLRAVQGDCEREFSVSPLLLSHPVHCTRSLVTSTIFFKTRGCSSGQRNHKQGKKRQSTQSSGCPRVLNNIVPRKHKHADAHRGHRWKNTIIGSGKVLSPAWRQTTIWNNVNVLSIESPGTNFSVMWNKMQINR